MSISRCEHDTGEKREGVVVVYIWTCCSWHILLLSPLQPTSCACNYTQNVVVFCKNQGGEMQGYVLNEIKLNSHHGSHFPTVDSIVCIVKSKVTKPAYITPLSQCCWRAYSCDQRPSTKPLSWLASPVSCTHHPLGIINKFNTHHEFAMFTTLLP